MKFSAKIQAFTDFRRHDRNQNREAKIAGKMALKSSAPAPIMSQKQRMVVVEDIKATMSHWTHSPFEREGDTRAALRSAFCLGGNSWVASDHEAQRITAEALEGAKRPSWEEGQWVYAVSEDYCKWCHGPMELGHAGRYCSAECAKSAMVHRDFGARVNGNRAFMDAYKTVRRFATPSKPCAQCAKDFHPANAEQQYCNKLCTTIAKNAHAKENPSTSTCVVCREDFPVFSLKGAMYCCTACQSTGARIKKGEWDPKRLTKQVFEQLVLGADRPAGVTLTPERFDGLVAA